MRLSSVLPLLPWKKKDAKQHSPADLATLEMALKEKKAPKNKRSS